MFSGFFTFVDLVVLSSLRTTLKLGLQPKAEATGLDCSTAMEWGTTDIPHRLTSHRSQLYQAEMTKPPLLRKDTMKREYCLNVSVQLQLMWASPGYLCFCTSYHCFPILELQLLTVFSFLVKFWTFKWVSWKLFPHSLHVDLTEGFYYWF